MARDLSVSSKFTPKKPDDVRTLDLRISRQWLSCDRSYDCEGPSAGFASLGMRRLLPRYDRRNLNRRNRSFLDGSRFVARFFIR
jgi:hypothetical protein